MKMREPSQLRKLTEAERAHIASWTDDEWLYVMEHVDPKADMTEGIAAVDELRRSKA